MLAVRLALQQTSVEVPTKPVTTHSSREYPAPTQELALCFSGYPHDRSTVHAASLRLSVKEDVQETGTKSFTRQQPFSVF